MTRSRQGCDDRLIDSTILESTRRDRVQVADYGVDSDEI
jgi:hypothetical protein